MKQCEHCEIPTHAESIELIKSFGAKFTPELKAPEVEMPYEGDYTQEVSPTMSVSPFRDEVLTINLTCLEISRCMRSKWPMTTPELVSTPATSGSSLSMRTTSSTGSRTRILETRLLRSMTSTRSPRRNSRPGTRCWPMLV